MPPRKNRPSQIPDGSSTLNIPPYSSEAESGVLGAIMLDAPRTMELCSEAGIAPESFWISPNRLIYEAAYRLYTSGMPVDIITVAEKLRADGNLDIVGGSVALERMVDATPAVAHAGYYTSILREKHTLRRIITAAQEAQEKCYSPDRSVELILSETEQSVLSIAENQANKLPAWSESVKSTVKRIDGLLNRTDGISGLSTGFHNIDKKMQGLRNSEMIVLAARPSMGKTSLAMNICENIALGNITSGLKKIPHAVAIFSCEMSTDALVTRMLCSKAQLSSYALVQGYVNKQLATTKLTRAASELTKAQIFIDDTGGLDIMDLRARARRMKKRNDVKLIMIDYLQLLNSREYAYQGRQLETSHISAQIKAMAKELDIPVIVLSQLSRAPDQRGDKIGKPRLSDLRDSGAIEQDADVVMMLRRPCRYEGDKESNDQTLAIVDIAKNRNGPVGEIRLNFMEEFTLFQDRVEDPAHESEYIDS